MTDFRVCTWHLNRVASGEARTDGSVAPVRWLPVCEECAEEFEPADWRPLRERPL
jgi:hypothetical protein